MTTPYKAEGRNCLNCGVEVETYTGHLQASEITLCESCGEEVKGEMKHRAQVVHTVPRKA